MYDVFFISDFEAESVRDFNRLKTIVPVAKHALTIDQARSKSLTQLYWVVWPGVVIDPKFNFNFKPDIENQNRIHMWLNNDDKSLVGVGLFPKSRQVSKRELDYRYFVNAVQVGTVATYSKGYDIAFISNNESYALSKLIKLQNHPGTFKNRIIHIDGIKGIHNAHIEAARQSSTKMFWIVDADAEVLEDFKFDINLGPNEEEMVHVWYSRNPVNGLEYGYGGIKLFPRDQVLKMPLDSVDMTTSISKDIKVIEQVANVTCFNTDPLSTWRSAFRECAKLSSKIISKQLDQETLYRLRSWRYNTSTADFAEYARSGASAGEWFGSTYKDDKDMLLKINDYEWLEAEFNQHIKMFPPETFK